MRKQDRESKRELSHLMVHFLNDCRSQGLVRPKPGATSFFQASHLGTRTKTFAPCSVDFLDTLPWSWLRNAVGEKVRYEPLSAWNAVVPLCHSAGPLHIIFVTLQRVCNESGQSFQN